MEIIEVFKTNVQEVYQAKQLIDKLLVQFPGCKINFDLHDCDKVLRVAGRKFRPEKIIELVTTHGYQCEILI